MSINLQYVYARINVTTGLCTSVATTSYEINNPAFILIPTLDDEYEGKYYNAVDGLWYHNAEFTQLWEECPSHQ